MRRLKVHSGDNSEPAYPGISPPNTEGDYQEAISAGSLKPLLIDIDGLPILQLRAAGSSPLYVRSKQVMDRLVASVLAVFVIPLLLPVAVVLRWMQFDPLGSPRGSPRGVFLSLAQFRAVSADLALVSL